MVAAAFIGPGTVTTCIMAGVRFGYALLWAILFATIGTIVLQEMSARLGVLGGVGLGTAIRRRFSAPLLRAGAALLVAGAIVAGNAAYQTGNLLGAALGVEVLGGQDVRVWAAVAAAAAFALLYTGRYRTIERSLVAMVVLMSVAFLVTAARLAGDLPSIVQGLSTPVVPAGGAVVALGLVGTTIVPYNLFLHADAARERFGEGRRLGDARFDLLVAIGLGGVVSMAIVVTAAAASAGSAGSPPESAVAMAQQLTPVLGRWATSIFAVGFLSAGLTSAITAPLAASYALAGALGWPPDLRDWRLRATWMGVLFAGAAFAVAGVRPVPAIMFAQAANGLLLPLVAVFLLMVMNDRRILGNDTNGIVANVLGGAIVILTAVLGVRAIMSVLAA